MADEREQLAGVVVASTKRISDVIDRLTSRCATQRKLHDSLVEQREHLRLPLDALAGIRHRLWETGMSPESKTIREALEDLAKAVNELDEIAIAVDAVATSLEIGIGVLARERIHLDVAAVGSAEKTHPGHPSGEYPRAR